MTGDDEDSAAVAIAHQENLKLILGKLLDAYACAGDDPTLQKEAEARFSRALELARRARDFARTLTTR